MPWKLQESQPFLSAVPPPMDSLWNYDLYGQPKDPETKQAWEDRELYASMVEEAEMQASMDDRRSSVLRNSAA